MKMMIMWIQSGKVSREMCPCKPKIVRVWKICDVFGQVHPLRDSLNWGPTGRLYQWQPAYIGDAVDSVRVLAAENTLIISKLNAASDVMRKSQSRARTARLRRNQLHTWLDQNPPHRQYPLHLRSRRTQDLLERPCRSWRFALG